MAYPAVRIWGSFAKTVRSTKPLWPAWELSKNSNKLMEVHHQMSLHGKDGYLSIGDFNVFSWSLSGIETSVVVKRHSDGFCCCFDLGTSNRENVKCDAVFISHGHVDHVSAVPQHVKKRDLYGGKPAKYYVPKHLVQPLRDVCSSFATIVGQRDVFDNVNIIGVAPDDPEPIKLSRNHYARPFSTFHRVPSQGYILYKQHKSLKAEFRELSGKEIAERVKAGEIVNDITETPELAFTGDTTFEVFTNQPPPDLLRVKLLIVEATYIDNESAKKDYVEQARKRGHIHLNEIYENPHLFKDVEHILLIHMSDKYSCEYIKEKVFENIPEELHGKIVVSTLAKERYL